MYFINKIIGTLANPTTMAILLLAVGGWLLTGKKLLAVSCWRLAFMVVLAFFWFWGTPLASRVIGLPLECPWLVDGEPPRAEGFPTADAIVCLGGGMTVTTNGFLSADINPGADRVWMAARLYKAGKAPKVLCTGPGCRASTEKLLLDFGVPTNALVFLEKPRNTEEESKAISDWLLARKLTANSQQLKAAKPKVLLVTSAWHMRRAKYMFEKYAPGLEIVPAPTDFESVIGFSKGFGFAELLPSGRAMGQNEMYFREWLGYLGYRFLR